MTPNEYSCCHFRSRPGILIDMISIIIGNFREEFRLGLLIGKKIAYHEVVNSSRNRSSNAATLSREVVGLNAEIFAHA